jgi:hypothetical protein
MRGSATEVEEVLLVGGMTRWPVPDGVERIFKEAVEGREPGRGRRARRRRVFGILAGDR